MSTISSGSLSFGDDRENEDDEEKESMSETNTPGGEQETKWQVVTETAGLTTAEIIAGRLQAEGIPARAWQEGAGQAFGLTVGLLGTGYVLVPEPLLDKAKEILATSEEFAADDDDDAADEESEKKNN